MHLTIILIHTPKAELHISNQLTSSGNGYCPTLTAFAHVVIVWVF